MHELAVSRDGKLSRANAVLLHALGDVVLDGAKDMGGESGQVGLVAGGLGVEGALSGAGAGKLLHLEWNVGKGPRRRLLELGGRGLE